MNENKPKRSIVNELLLQKCFAKEHELCSMKEDESECANKKQKCAKNEVACNVKNNFKVSNVFECGRNNPEVSCERACMVLKTMNIFRIFLTL